MEINQRVGAVASVKNGKMKLFGYGVYLGNKIPETDDIKSMGVSLKKYDLSNPCIQLDNGDIVWGCECWWGAEEEIKKTESQCKEVVIISPSEYRKQ